MRAWNQKATSKRWICDILSYWGKELSSFRSIVARKLLIQIGFRSWRNDCHDRQDSLKRSCVRLLSVLALNYHFNWARLAYRSRTFWHNWRACQSLQGLIFWSAISSAPIYCYVDDCFEQTRKNSLALLSDLDWESFLLSSIIEGLAYYRLLVIFI